MAGALNRAFFDSWFSIAKNNALSFIFLVSIHWDYFFILHIDLRLTLKTTPLVD
jgi:hypothetical protein